MHDPIWIIWITWHDSDPGYSPLDGQGKLLNCTPPVILFTEGIIGDRRRFNAKEEFPVFSGNFWLNLDKTGLVDFSGSFFNPLSCVEEEEEVYKLISE